MIFGARVRRRPSALPDEHGQRVTGWRTKVNLAVVGVHCVDAVRDELQRGIAQRCIARTATVPARCLA